MLTHGYCYIAAMRRLSLFLPLIIFAGSCSVYMEATRPTPTDLSQFDRGQTRDSVLERLGAPLNTVAESDGLSCDMYQLYTSGYGAGGKIPIAIAEGAADFFTLGLAEVVLTPTEGVTKNQKRPVAFCYRDQKLIRLAGDNVPIFDASNPPVTAASHTLPASAWAPSASATEASPAAAATPLSAPSGGASVASASASAAAAPSQAASPAAAAASPAAPAGPATQSVAPAASPAGQGSVATPAPAPSVAAMSPAAAEEAGQ